MEFSDTSTTTRWRKRSGRRGSKKWSTTEIMFNEEEVFSTQRVPKKSWMAEVTPNLCEDRFQLVTLRMQISTLKSNELSSVKSSKNILSLESHYYVMPEQSLLQGKACVTCEQIWELSSPVLSYFFNQFAPSIKSWQKGTRWKMGKVSLLRSLPDKENKNSV